MPYILLSLFIIVFLCTNQAAFSNPPHKIHHQKNVHKKTLIHKKMIAHQKKVPSKKKVKPVKNNLSKKKMLHKKILSKKISKHPSLKMQRPGPIPTAQLPNYLLTEPEKNLLDYIYQTITSLRYTTYQLGGSRIDTSRGIFVVDCSSYVNHVLKNVYPKAYAKLTSVVRTEKPTTYDFYQYFTNLIAKDRSHWQVINKVDKLRPGDILVFRYLNSLGKERGGHVMVVMDKPVRYADKYAIRVSDSASGGHSLDTRKRYVSGIGVGILSLKVNNKIQPNAYAWKLGARWENRVNFAMARPIEMKS